MTPPSPAEKRQTATTHLTAADVWSILAAQAPPWASTWPNPSLESVVIDSRQAGPGSLFVALPGERTDGHHFVAHALSRGALLALVDHSVEADCRLLDATQPASMAAQAQPSFPLCLLVQNTLRALQQIAAAWRTRFTPRVIGVTGSVGKTTSKEIIAAVLEQRYATLKSPGNLNNEIGLPLTLMQLNAGHERVVLEMGMYDVGEIAQLCQIARPHVGVVTNVGPVHLERAGSIERIAQAKAELVAALPPDGVAILNADDPLVAAMDRQTSARVFRYGLCEPTGRPAGKAAACDLWADEIVSEGLDGIRFRFHHAGEMIHVKAPLLGRHSVHVALRAASVGLVEGLSWEEIVSGLQDVGAQLRLVVAPGLRGATLLDDTYNASPASSLAALNLLADLDVNGGRRIALLGDMLELGGYEETGHRIVGARAADVVDKLITVGRRARWIAEEAIAAGLAPANVEAVADVQAALLRLQTLIGPGDVVLVKGSRATRLDTVVAALSQPRAASGDPASP